MCRHKEDVTMSITIYAGARLDGCKIKDFPWPTDCIVMVVYRGEEKIIPNGQLIQRNQLRIKSLMCYTRIFPPNTFTLLS